MPAHLCLDPECPLKSGDQPPVMTSEVNFLRAERLRENARSAERLEESLAQFWGELWAKYWDRIRASGLVSPEYSVLSFAELPLPLANAFKALVDVISDDSRE